MVQEASRIFFQVHTGDTNLARLTIVLNAEIAITTEWNIVLRDLIALHQVWIGIVLAVELGVLWNGAVKGQSRHNRVGNGLLVNDRQDTGHTHTDRANMCVWSSIRVVSATGAEHFTFCE